MPTIREIQTDRVAGAFDSVAPIFEATLENEITRALRQKVYDAIDRLILLGSSILDINCGIGIDAVELARKGYYVVGVDLSPKMVEQARMRASQQGVKSEFLQSSFEDLSVLDGKQFDLVLSNFGGLNCVKSLDAVAAQVTAVTKPGGYFLAVVMPRVSMWETVAGLIRLKPSLAFRRFKKETLATGFPGKTFRVSYFSPRTFAHAFKPWFRVRSIHGLNVLTPPPHAIRFKQKNPQFSSFLRRCDKILGGLPVLRSIGDHSLIVLKKK
jgi:ubiquinone/menaquinone biosynthesis C-methylase UbiE